jgi:hypothetical protein
MSYQEDFDAWKDEIENLSPESVKLPNLPIDEFAPGAEALAVEANKDREALATAGLDMALIDDLATLSGALRHCQAQWMSEYRAREEAQKEWQRQLPRGNEVRNELLHHFSFAYRSDGNLRKQLMRIREGRKHADMVQDLVELAFLGEKNPRPLTAINFDLAKLQQARKMSHDLAELLAASNSAAAGNSVSKQLRDKAFTLLFKKDSTIREYGRYVFWKDEARKSKYYKQ